MREPFVPIEHRPLLNVPEAAALTGLPVKTVRHAIDAGELTVCYAGSTTKRIRRADLEDWLRRLPVEPV